MYYPILVTVTFRDKTSFLRYVNKKELRWQSENVLLGWGSAFTDEGEDSNPEPEFNSWLVPQDIW